MIGKVIKIRRLGILAEMDVDASTIADGTKFEIYRFVNTTETSLGLGTSSQLKAEGKRIMFPKMIAIDSIDGEKFNGVQIGDLVRFVS